MKPVDFDIFTKGPGSPSKLSKRFKPVVDPVAPRLSGKFDAEELVGPSYEEELLKEQTLKQEQRPVGDPFLDLGVSAADKMSFFLLKWVFNAIKRESSDDDPVFKGKPYVSQKDLIKQLSKNPELMHALGYEDAHQFAEAVNRSSSKKEGFLMWSEFLDFFFLKGATLPPSLEKRQDWWVQLDSKGRQLQAEDEKAGEGNEDADAEGDYDATNAVNLSGLSGGGTTGAQQARIEKDNAPVTMTPSLRFLQSTRAQKAEKEVEEEFRQLAAEKRGTAKAPTKEKTSGRKQV